MKKQPDSRFWQMYESVKCDVAPYWHERESGGVHTCSTDILVLCMLLTFCLEVWRISTTPTAILTIVIAIVMLPLWLLFPLFMDRLERRIYHSVAKKSGMTDREASIAAEHYFKRISKEEAHTLLSQSDEPYPELLRPASSDDASLLRPAGATTSDSSQLLRPIEIPDERKE